MQQQPGGQATFCSGDVICGWGRNLGYQRRNTSSSSSLRIFVRVCNKRCAPRSVHCICCFLTNRLLTTWLMVDSTNAVLIVSTCRYRSPKFGIGFPVIANVGLEFRHPSRQFLCRRRTLRYQVQIHQEVAQTFQRLLDIAVPQQVLDALYPLRYLPAAGFRSRLQRLDLLLENRQPHRDVKPVDDVFPVGVQIFLHPPDIFTAVGHEYHLLVLLHPLRFHQDSRWNTEREQGYTRLSLPSQTEPVLQHLELELDRVAGKAIDGLPTNPFASVHNGRLKLKRPDALEIPDSTKELRRVFESSLQKERIEHLLRHVDGLCRFTDALRSPGKEVPPKNVLQAA